MDLLFLITLMLLTHGNGVVESAYQYTVDGSNYYVSTPDTANWYQAMQFCTFNGMYLVDVRTHFENTRILWIINRTRTAHNITYGNYWTSGTDLGNEGQYYWATNGNPMLYTDWAAAEPSDSSRENCIHYYDSKSFKWNDSICELKYFFICRDTLDVPLHKRKECSIFSSDSI